MIAATASRDCAIVRRYLGLILMCLPATRVPLRADVTLRYESRLIVNPGLPAELRKSLDDEIGKHIRPSFTEQFKNGTLYLAYDEDQAIVDFAKRQVTLLEGETKRYSLISIEQYLKEIVGDPSAPASTTKGAPSLRGHSDFIETGRTTVVAGVVADEFNFVFTADTSDSTVPVVRVVMHLWTAKESEVKRVPALAEVALYERRIFEVTDPVGSIMRSLRRIPELANAFVPFTEALRPDDMLVRFTADCFVPALASAARELRKLPAGTESPLAPSFDPDAPLIEIVSELISLSTEPIADDVFAVPANFKRVTFAQLMADN